MVATTIPPAFKIPNQQATIIGLFAERIKTRFPDCKPKSSIKHEQFDLLFHISLDTSKFLQMCE
jgi:hypothetical protein